MLILFLDVLVASDYDLLLENLKHLHLLQLLVLNQVVFRVFKHLFVMLSIRMSGRIVSLSANQRHVVLDVSDLL